MENTQAKHYEQLKIEPWEIMEKDFTHEEFVGYLKGNILKYTLRKKEQDITDAKKIKHYAEKLIEVLTEGALKEDLIDPEVQSFIEDYEKDVKEAIRNVYRFKVGDRVLVNDYTYTNKRASVVQLDKREKNNYIVQFDNEEYGWKDKENVVAEHNKLPNKGGFWYINGEYLTPLEELETNKWYDARKFELDKLEKLLPVGTLIEVLVYRDADRSEVEPTKGTKTSQGTVKSINTGEVYIAEWGSWNYWFKILEYPKE